MIIVKGSRRGRVERRREGRLGIGEVGIIRVKKVRRSSMR